MPPRRSTTSAQNERKRPRSSTAEFSSESVATEKSSFLDKTLAIIRDERTRYIVASILFFLVIYFGFAYVSYFFTGSDDYSHIHAQQSLIEQSANEKYEYKNWTGSFGARAADTMIDGGFGVAVGFAIYALLIIALKLVKAPVPSVTRTIGHCSFWMIWLSITIGLLFKNIYQSNSFFRWGGKHGLVVSDFLVGYIQYSGTLIVLLSTLLIYLIIVDKRTVPTLKKIGLFIYNFFHKSQQEDSAEPDSANEDSEQANEGELDNQSEDNITEDDNTDNDEEQAAIETDLSDDKPIDDNNDDSDNNGNDDDLQTGVDENVADEDNSNQEFIITNQQEVGQDNNEPGTDSDADDNTDDEHTEQSQEAVLEIIDTPEEEMTDEQRYEKMMAELGPYDPRKDLEYYTFPPFDGKTDEERVLKVYPNENAPVINMDEQEANKNRIINTLRSYGVEITRISATIGPTVTLYEIVPKEGTRISKIKNLENDIMLSLSAMGIRIIAPIPGKGTIGIEVPNEKPQIVSMHSVIASRKFQEERKMALPVVLGKTITNEVFMFDLAKTPHLLVAGATGQGKSVGLNAIITSLLYKKHPSELKFVLVDPKMVEFSIYKSIEKNYIAETPDQEDPIITDCEKVKNILNSLVIEMENRYTKLMEAHCRNIIEFNDKVINRRLSPDMFMPYLVIIIDEFGDFIMQAGKEVEMPIARIAQKARAVGMHMILATQRPSANVITGIIKANVPARIAFRVGSQIDSRVILDTKGAEQLIGKGDLLYSAGQEPTRIQCAFVDTPEVEKLVAHISRQQSYSAPYQLPEYIPEGEEGEALKPGEVDLHKLDPLFKEVATYVVLNQQGSTSVLQRKFGIGYNRAGKLSDQLEAAGIVGPNRGPKGRDVLIMDEVTLAQKLRELGIE